MHKRIVYRLVCSILGVLLCGAALFLMHRKVHGPDRPEPPETILQARPTDWPQWHGPERNNRSRETGLLKVWPKTGPRMRWKTAGLGQGWSSPSIAYTRIFVTGTEARREFLACLDITGQFMWKVFYGSAFHRYPGARSTPAIADGCAYVISGRGEVVCIDIPSRMIKWKLDGFTIFEGKTHHFGTAECPLVFNNKVFYTPGGERTTVVALHKETGQTLWQSPSLNDQAAYVSPLLIRHGNRDILVTVTGMHIVAIDPQTGAIVWTYPYVQAHMTRKSIKPLIQNAVSPLYDKGQIYVTSGYDHVGVALQLSEDGSQVSLRWEDRNLDCHHGGVILHEGHLYGSSWHSNFTGNWVCLDWETGGVRYDCHWFDKGAILYADGMLYCYEEQDGHLALVKATPDAFEIISTFKITLGTGEHWAHPVIHNGILYIRRGESLAAFDIKKTSPIGTSR
jgi:outer membrane protein assembly factor BamB